MLQLGFGVFREWQVVSLGVWWKSESGSPEKVGLVRCTFSEVSLGSTAVRTVAERKEVRRTPIIRLLTQKTSSGTIFGCFKGMESRRFSHLSRIVGLGTSKLVQKCQDSVTRVEAGSLTDLVSHWPGAC